MYLRVANPNKKTPFVIKIPHAGITSSSIVGYDVVALSMLLSFIFLIPALSAGAATPSTALASTSRLWYAANNAEPAPTKPNPVRPHAKKVRSAANISRAIDPSFGTVRLRNIEYVADDGVDAVGVVDVDAMRCWMLLRRYDVSLRRRRPVPQEVPPPHAIRTAHFMLIEA
jgi:hypothetical protein